MKKDFCLRCLLGILIMFIVFSFCSRKDAPKKDQPQSASDSASKSNIQKTEGVNKNGPFASFETRLQPLSDSSAAFIKRLSKARSNADYCSAFLQFRQLHREYQDSASYPFISSDSVQDILQDSAMEAELNRVLHKYGYGLFPGEDVFYVDEEMSYYIKLIGDNIKEPIASFLHIRQGEQSQGFSEDAVMAITFDSLSERIAHWEKLIASDKSQCLDSESQGWYHAYLSTYFLGMDNTRVFETGDSVSDEARMSYKRFIKKYGQTKSGKLIANYYSVLAAHKFRYGPFVDSFMQSNKIKSMLWVQPPLR